MPSAREGPPHRFAVRHQGPGGVHSILHEGRIPFYQATTDEEIAEAKRLFYVGVTRSEQFLLYVTDSSHYRNTPTCFLRAASGVGMC